MSSDNPPLFSYIRNGDRIALFIDGANLYSSVRGLSFDIDYQKLRTLFLENGGRVIRAFYYTALLEDKDQYYALRPLVDWLGYNGFAIVSKAAKEFTSPDGHKRIKGNMDIELAIDMMELAPHIDHAILFSGDGDFRRLVEVTQRQGVIVTVISTMRSNPPMVADDLRRQADYYYDLDEIKGHISRNHSARRENGIVVAPSIDPIIDEEVIPL